MTIKGLISRSCTLLACTLPLTAQNAKIKLVNGDTISGSISGYSKDSVTLTAPYLKKPMQLATKGLKSIKLDNEKNRKPANISGLITLKPRFVRKEIDQSFPLEVIKGEITSINGKGVTVKTPYAGNLNLNKEMVESIEVVRNEKVVFRGPGQLKDWSQRLSKSSAWKQTEFGFETSEPVSGIISRKLDFPEKYRIDITLEGSLTNQRFRLVVNGEEGSAYSSKKTSYTIQSYGTNFYGQYSQNNRGHRMGSAAIPQELQALNGDIKYTFYVDSLKGVIVIHINGKYIDTFQAANADLIEKKNLGTYIHIQDRLRTKLKLKKLNISEWSGSAPDKSATKRYEKLKQDGQKIVLQNQDIIFGEVISIEGGILHLKTKYCELKFPINSVKNLDLGDQAESSIRMEPNDIRVTFLDGSTTIFQLRSVENGKFKGYSQAFGEALFDIKQVKSIDYNIY